MTAQCEIGLIGLAMSGQNLILNMADHSYQVAAYNRSTGKVAEFIEGAAQADIQVGSPAEIECTKQAAKRHAQQDPGPQRR